MVAERTGISRRFDAVLRFFGLREDPNDSDAQRRNVDLLWAVFGPVLIVIFVWTFAGETIGLLAILVMVPFLVVGVRDVLSGRAAERRRRSGHDAPPQKKSR